MKLEIAENQDNYVIKSLDTKFFECNLFCMEGAAGV